MKYVQSLLLLLLVLVSFSCEDFLEPGVSDRGKYDEEFVWSNPTFASGPLYYAYSGLPTTFRTVGGDYTDIATDNAVSNDISSSMRNFGLGLLSSSNNAMDNWANYYQYIRSLNIFIENGLSPIDDDDLEHNVKYYSDSTENAEAFVQYKGEAYFMRAWYHWSLLKLYGAKVDGNFLGIPVVTTILSEDEAFNLSRNTYNETVWAIAADCDTAAKYLQAEYSGTDKVIGEIHYGAPTTHAARSLKAMAYVFAASPAYTDGVITWDSAAYYLNEALVSIDGALNSSALPMRSFDNTVDEDAIWRSMFYTNNFSNEIQNYPPSYRGNGETNPSHDLVKCFPAYDGRPFDNTHPAYNAIMSQYTPYTSNVRDPRLARFIMSDGYELSGSPNLGLDDYYVWTYTGGRDSRENYPITGTKTGYYLKKFSNGIGTELYPSNKNGSTGYYTAISKVNLYLFLAEALNRAMNDPTSISSYGVSAKDILRKVRGTYFSTDPYCDEQAVEGQVAFEALIKNERRIELCFEDTRFWDIRRWGMDVNVSVHGIRISLTDELHQNPNIEFVKDYEEFEVEKRMFAAESLPIPYSEINLMPNLMQNEGWE